MALLRRAYYWSHIEDDISQYVRTFLVCQKDKSDHLIKAGLLEPLPVPKRLWEGVSLDFIIGLPEVGDITTVLVVVDWFSKYTTFIAAPKYVSA